jgi:predicted phosphodiesterase
MRIAVVSDIHSNLPALNAVLDDAAGVDSVWHLGDVVGYGPQPDAVVARLIELGAAGVKGNHDDACCGGDSIDSFSPDAYAAAAWTRRNMGSAARDFLSALPELLVPEGMAFTLAHGSPRDPFWEYVDETWIAAENLDEFSTKYCLVGHTHMPIQYTFTSAHRPARWIIPEMDQVIKLKPRAIINPGSIGQPRDHDPRASFAILDTDALTWQPRRAWWISAWMRV